ncbi:MAG: hypothetical protein L0271_26250 [Gemmatimonadetes bacterium]|nr:hypothetical protein [Gemmatimonadota bacterium]
MPVRPQLVADSAAHSLSGSAFAATLPQTPFAPLPFFVALHAWHRPAHGLSQQTPSTHCPVAHCPVRLHASPADRSGLQIPPAVSHQCDAMHPASSVHAVAQTLAVAHVYGEQSVVLPLTQLPLPSHAWPVWTPAEQALAPHVVPTVHLAHAPMPSHAPFRPHVLCGSAVHSLSGSLAGATGPHAPSAPAPFFAALHA